MTYRVFIGFGSNQGDRLATFANAAQRLHPAVVSGSMRTSPVYETHPIGPTGDEPFLNAVIECRSSRRPQELLVSMQNVELALGRRPPYDGPRPIDLDLLFYDDLIVETDQLQIPHPRLHERDFVLRPMTDLDSGFRHPLLKRSMRDLLDDLKGTSCLIGVFAPGIPGLPLP